MIENPIIRGFAPDPSIIRVDEDYYIATSTFEWWPGIKLYHSKDLKHWEQLPSPLNRISQLNMLGNPTSGGVWAPCLSYSDGKFYIVFTDVKTKKGRYYNNHNYLVEAEDIRGEWSEPIYLNSTGFDPSLFHDGDGRKYLVNMRNGFKGILLQEYDVDKKQLIGSPINIFQGTEAGYTEGPHLYHIGEWYYLMVAEGGTGYGHCVTMARSKRIEGPYEVDPQNPLLTSRADDGAYLQKCGHADLTDTSSGEWYITHLCSRPLQGEKACVLGRETAIQKVYWDKEGWLRLVQVERKASQWVEEPAYTKEYPFEQVPVLDHFEQKTLGLQYVMPRVPLNEHLDLESRKGYVRLFGQESLNSLHQVSLLAVKQGAYQIEVETEMEFTPKYPEQLAGLTYMYDAMNFYILGKTVDEMGKEILTLIESNQGVVTDKVIPIPLESHEKLYLKVQTDEVGRYATFYYAYDQSRWFKVCMDCETYILTDEHCRGFTGAHLGIYCHDMTGLKCFADFDYFSYRE